MFVGKGCVVVLSVLKKFLLAQFLLAQLLLSQFLLAQPGHLMSGLLNFSPQANFLQPAYAPEGQLFVGLPGLSRISILANNRLSYRDIFLSERDPVELLSSQRNSLAIEANVGLFLFGYKSAQSHYVSLFLNQRLGTFFYYPRDFVKLFWQGNASLIGREQYLGSLQTELLAYQEIGLGYSFPISKRLRLGAHLKYLIGLANLSMPRAAEVDLQIDSDTFVHTFTLRNFRIRSSTIPIDSSAVTTYMPMLQDLSLSRNRGMAADIGMSYDISPLLNLSVSLRDIGMISWRDSPRVYTVEHSYTTLGDVDLNMANIDSLRSNLVDDFGLSIDTLRYNSSLHSSVFSTFSWRLSRDNYLSASHTFQRLPGSFLGRVRTYYSLSYMRHMSRNFSASASIMGYPQHITLGLACVYNVGAFQLYGALGNVLGLFDVPGMRVADISLGVNIITGRRFRKYDRSARLCP